MFEIPADLRVAIGAGLTFLFTQGLKALANLLGFDIAGWTSAVVAALVGAVLVFLDGIVALIPPELQPVASAIFGLIVVVLGSFGVHYTYKGVAVR
jgi:hypothetical protein